MWSLSMVEKFFMLDFIYTMAPAVKSRMTVALWVNRFSLTDYIGVLMGVYKTEKSEKFCIALFCGFAASLVARRDRVSVNACIIFVAGEYEEGGEISG